jgi:hypothetical protein
MYEYFHANGGAKAVTTICSYQNMRIVVVVSVSASVLHSSSQKTSKF